jgi:iron complex outermembrane receptor protein
VAVASGWRLGLNLSHTERAPAAEELLANGPHAGTQAYEIGDPTLAKEKANGVELVLRGRGKGYSLEASAYYTRFSDYIYEAQTGAVIDGLPVFAERQGDARHLGFEVQGDVTLATFGLWSLRADALADYVDAKLLDGGGPVPRIPPLRMLGGLTLDSDRATGRIEVEHAFAQDRLAPFETRTDSFTLVNASVSVQPFTDRPGTSIVLSANNIFDVDSRRHASFLKDFAPLPGRDIRLSLRFTL